VISAIALLELAGPLAVCAALRLAGEVAPAPSTPSRVPAGRTVRGASTASTASTASAASPGAANTPGASAATSASTAGPDGLQPHIGGALS
jgi:hypothetical protein